MTRSGTRAYVRPLSWAVVLLFLLLAASLKIGIVPLPWSTIAERALGRNLTALQAFVIRDIRLPRALVAAMTGVAFGMGGSLLQSALRNPLVDASVIGVNDGAGLIVTLVLVFIPQISGWWLPAIAFAGAACALAVLLLLTRRVHFEPTAVLLTGIALSASLYATTKIVKTLGDWQLVQGAIQWLQGDLTAVSWFQVELLLPWLIAGSLLAWVCSPSLDILELGDAAARSLGRRPARIRLVAFFASVALCGSAVAVTGPVYFVGFLSANAARRILPGANRKKMLLAGLLGGSLVVAADLLARTLIAPREFRLIFLIGLIGAPCFAALLVSQARSRVRFL